MSRTCFRRSAAALLSVIVGVAAWSPLFAVAPAAAHCPSEASKPKDSCACPDCPGEDQCACHHGHAPEGSRCSAPKPETGDAAADTALPIPVGKLLCILPEPVIAPGFQSPLPDSESVPRSSPYPAPPDKVPI